MTSLWDPQVQAELTARIARLTPDARPRWGRMTCPQMVVHITDALALYRGDLHARTKHTPLCYPPLKQVVLYLLPIPKNVPTAPELLARAAGEWSDELAALRCALTRFCSESARTDWPPHPLFGRMSCRAYGVLAYRHTDHHLRQFGV
jgi:hypothetical protein